MKEQNKTPCDPVKDYRDIHNEIRGWESYLNDNLGNFSFAFAVASIGTNQPQFWALLSLVFAMLVYISKRDAKTEILRALESKEQKTEYDNFLIGEYRNSINPKRLLPLIFGVITLTAIIVAPAITSSSGVMSFLYGEKPYFNPATFTVIHSTKGS